ncbi:MAG: 30S ribosome-binding factor RbfA [Chloroflexi bacterium AL-W]|nr:30S ribosome-binding factor RbfA [Chloroflexi bacterium AL-N1]NOK64813.1 30S ribosome-binding factor RbfA [Chloroflexi bacterium AL-N10]NOK76583.1 30S ribosome-binding factor RbfA [Chloroflexi bacterium AL-N5]NOK80187.1 30S ribosome-binding factor RbfA [Chloroflexi bacterium AL-W]NOK86700.1 30S ribosome-binding factor RbfA [Chloroflexi bacterium AL-N15]
MSKRTQQVGDEIQRILSEVIQYELQDPRVGFATITHVKLSIDLQHARVWISVMGDEVQQDETIAALNHAKGFLRRRVAQELRHLRVVPELRFSLDDSLNYTERMDSLLRQVAEEREQNTDKNETDQQSDSSTSSQTPPAPTQEQE